MYFDSPRRTAARRWAVSYLLALASAALQAQTPPPPADETAASAISIDWQAPEPLAAFLRQHAEIERYRLLVDLDASEIKRLLLGVDANLRELLATQGYFSPSIEVSQPAERQLRVRVEPGPPTRVSEVALSFGGDLAPAADTGATPADLQRQTQRERIRSEWGLPVGQLFTQERWDAAKASALKSLLSERYPLGQILSSQAGIDPQAHSARLTLDLDAGPMFQIRSARISGLNRYSEPLVLNWARLPLGRDYSQRLLLDAQDRLMASELFSSAYVTLDTESPPDQAVLDVQLKEAPSQKLVFAVGASTDSGPRASVEHTHQQIPLLNWRMFNLLSLEREQQKLGTDLSSPPDANNWRWALSAQLEQLRDAGLRSDDQRLSAGRQQRDTDRDRSFTAYADLSRLRFEDTVIKAQAVSAMFGLTQRSFDDLTSPTRGHGWSVELGPGYTLLPTRSFYARGTARWLSLWQPFRPRPGADGDSLLNRARSGRLALRLEGGALQAQSDARLPTRQLFLAGGDNSVRGYGPRTIGVPRNGYIGGGRYMALASLEWQQPLVINKQLSDWEAVVFVDSGAVADDRKAFKAYNGYGVGARWRSPVGPLQLAVAYGDRTRKLRLHLNVGFRF